jgi:hypothetical protein
LIFPISVSQVARITGINHKRLTSSMSFHITFYLFLF